jgi:hypothetical protein
MTRARTCLARLGAIGLLGALGLLSGCPNDDGNDDAVEPDFPADYASSYVEVRNCRPSGDHNLNTIRILASPSALAPYQDREDPFPLDAVVLKEEFDFGDSDCSGPIKEWTVMRRLETGSSSETLDWHWQRVGADRRVLDENKPLCIGCHQGCGVAPDGYDWTCAMP